eukprot:CAMPEP_0194135808 /NCGR_PEP_ID=MMETSP0152-20130528/5890_1 /TAXON_ID=1049557 /ORGANISM="Thalassiothrix antarctica, Strain L6-D1" /LENGTH=138 /DNA_ID=CAMNT_0038832215 /DNA_START=34 /DNA_END=450 /DNA_ORIENTATION=-
MVNQFNFAEMKASVMASVKCTPTGNAAVDSIVKGEFVRSILAKEFQERRSSTLGEMKALGGIVKTECEKEFREMVEDRANEDKKTQYKTCLSRIRTKSYENCADSFTALVECHESTNPGKSLCCDDLKSAFEECYENS